MSAVITAAGTATANEPASERQGERAGAGDDRRLSPRHRCAQAQRHRHDLRPARHPDHRPRRAWLQAEGLRVISFRHEQNAGYAASIAGLPDAEARHLPDRVGARLPQRPDRARQRDDQLLPDDPDQRLERARDRRPAAGRLRGDGPARDRQAALQGGVPRAARRGHRHRHRARDPRGGLGPPGRRLPRPAGQAVRAGDRRRGRQELADQGRRSGAAPDPGARRGRSARSTC